MLNAARWIVFSLLVVSVLILAGALGYVYRGDSSSAAARPAAGTNGVSAEDFSNLNQMLKLLKDKYVDPNLVDDKTLYEAAITGLLQTFPDSGTYYVDANTIKTSVGLSGKFEGIGATVSTQNGQIVIVAPIDDTPAQRAGIKAGDAILEVDGESTSGWTQEKAVLKIRGQAGTTVKLKVRHADGQEETLDIERDEIKVASVTTQPPGGALKDGSGTEITDIGYAHIREFTELTTDEMKKVLQGAVGSGKKGFVLDLRNNPGGLLLTTEDIADEFLDGNKAILTERDRDGKESVDKSHDGGIATQIPVVIILNRFSASGSEVLAAALHDNGRATIVGEKSFGKGTVNIANNLKDGGQLYISIANWLTPNGTLIEGVGIRPDIAVHLSDDDIDARRDVQLFKALDVLRGTDTTPAISLTPQPSTPAAEAAPTRSGG
ncbi:MAG: S41 family peptidase [Chloroflexota bacterium]|nr:S41 family peptidase [Chloroflexota bacterium]